MSSKIKFALVLTECIPRTGSGKTCHINDVVIVVARTELCAYIMDSAGLDELGVVENTMLLDIVEVGGSVLMKQATLSRSLGPIDLHDMDIPSTVVPRWALGRQFLPESLISRQYSKVTGDAIVVGLPTHKDLTALFNNMDVGSTVFVFGGKVTGSYWSNGKEFNRQAVLVGLHVIYTEVKCSQFATKVADCPGLDLASVGAFVCGLTTYTAEFEQLFSQIVSHFRTQTLISLVGPAYNSNGNVLVSTDLENPGLSAGSIGAVKLEKSGDAETLIVTSAPFVRTPVAMQPAAPPSFMGMPLDQVVEEGYAYYASAADATTMAEWKAAGNAMQAKHPQYIAGIAAIKSAIPGLVVEGPDWASRHVDNWGAWLQQAVRDGASATTGVVIGTFEQLSVLTWTALGMAGSGGVPPRIITIDPGRTLAGPWGTPRVASTHKNAPLNVVPLVGQSGVVMPLLAARMAFDDEFALFVEVDGSHHCDDVLLDCEYGWRVLCQYGLLVLDDYSGWTQSDYQAIDSTSVFSATRGIHAFMHLHRGEYRVLRHETNQFQLCLQKIVPARHMIGSEAAPYDMDAEWEACEQEGRLHRESRLPRPALPGLKPEAGDLWFDAENQGEFALAAVEMIPKVAGMAVAAPAQLFEHASINIGGGLEKVGQYLGHEQEHNAWAGAGQMFKSFGNGALKTSQFAGWTSRKAAELFIPRENRWW